MRENARIEFEVDYTENIYKEIVAFLNSLYGNITIEDILAGLSTSRNPHLQSICMRLEYVEAIGSGLRRVNSYYENRGLKFEVKALPTSFVVKIPRITLENKITDDDKTIIDYINKNGEITRKEAEQIIGKEKTTVTYILNKMIENKMITKIGNGPKVRYIIK